MDEPAKRQGLVINHRLPKKPIVIDADPERIEQILYNLLSNAIKYSEKGKITLSITLGQLKKGHKKIPV